MEAEKCEVGKIAKIGDLLHIHVQGCISDLPVNVRGCSKLGFMQNICMMIFYFFGIRVPLNGGMGIQKYKNWSFFASENGRSRYFPGVYWLVKHALFVPP